MNLKRNRKPVSFPKSYAPNFNAAHPDAELVPQPDPTVAALTDEEFAAAVAKTGVHVGRHADRSNAAKRRSRRGALKFIAEAINIAADILD